MTRQTIKRGDYVRVARSAFHGIKFGSVCEVVSETYADGTMAVCGPSIDNDIWQTVQIVDGDEVKLAKQTMRNREQYANRR